MTNAASTTTTETAAIMEPGANVALEKVASKKATNQKKGAPKAKRSANAAKPAAKPKGSKKERKPHAASASREGTAKAKVIAMLERSDGATLEQIRKSTGWQPHTVRGFVSTLSRKH